MILLILKKYRNKEKRKRKDQKLYFPPTNTKIYIQDKSENRNYKIYRVIVEVTKDSLQIDTVNHKTFSTSDRINIQYYKYQIIR